MRGRRRIKKIKMASSDKSGDLKVTFTKDFLSNGLEDFRKKLLCRKCEKLPRPGIELMRCRHLLCSKILCGNCCGIGLKVQGLGSCPLCNGYSDFVKESELMEVLSGFKTHPCVNLKNGCSEEIAAKLDNLRAHDLSCVFQKVPCPDCEENVIFKDMGQHLKQAHANDGISISYDTETNEYTYKPDIYGIYNLQAMLINGRKYYKKDNFAISWDGKTSWSIGHEKTKGNSMGFAGLKQDVQNLHNSTHWFLTWGNLPAKIAGKMLKVKGEYYDE